MLTQGMSRTNFEAGMPRFWKQSTPALITGRAALVKKHVGHGGSTPQHQAPTGAPGPAGYLIKPPGLLSVHPVTLARPNQYPAQSVVHPALHSENPSSCSLWHSVYPDEAQADAAALRFL